MSQLQSNTTELEALLAEAEALPQAMPITGGAFTGAVTVPAGTDYTAYRLRNVAILTSEPSSMANGDIALVRA